MKITGLGIIALILITVSAQAKTASEVFESVSSSVVVIRTYDEKGKDKMLGSGVIWEDGIVATDCHVVKDAGKMQVERQGVKYPATLLHSDWGRDICSLSVDGLKGKSVTKGSTTRLKVGDKVYAVGAPRGLDLTLSDGLISSFRPVTGGKYLQITAPISPGSSGGGLFDDEGRLIGLPTFYLTEGQQLNFALPVEWINELPKRTAPAPKAGKRTSAEWFNQTVELKKKKDWPGLVKHTLQWTKALPGDAPAWSNLGVAYRVTGQPAKAIKAYQQAIRINPDYAIAWNNLGVVYKSTGQTDKVMQVYKRLKALDPGKAELYFDKVVLP